MDLMEDQEVESLAQVGEWQSLSDAHEHALVVLAMNLDCQVMETARGFAVFADPAQAEPIQREFGLYASEQERVAEPRVRVDSRIYPLGVEWLVVWAAALFAVFVMQAKDPSLTSRFSNSSEALVAGKEWWRPFTALFLHADGGHLLGNVAIGGIFCAIVARSLGAALGWPLILLGGTLANAINAVNRFPGHFESIGASTATFAALGILVGNASCEAWKYEVGRRWQSILMPLVAGFILLGWYGTGGDNTDVGGHFWGWLVGASLGFTAALVAEKSKPVVS